MKKVHPWIRPAMALTILFITGFQAYWVYTRYTEEQKLSQKEIKVLFREVFLEEQLGISVSSTEGAHIRMMHTRVNIDSACKDSAGWKGHHPMHLLLQDTIPMNLDSFTSAFLSRVSATGNPSSIAVFVTRKPDTLLDTSGIFFPHPMPLEIDSGEFISARVEQPFTYILGRIWMNIAVSLAVVLLTATMMLALYKNLRTTVEAAAQQQQFISNVSHELKTPIATVSVALEALQHFNAMNDANRTREYLLISRQEMARLSLMADRILSLSLLEAGKIELQKEPCDLLAIAREVTEALSVVAAKGGGYIRLDAPGTGYIITGDKLHLAGILHNLVDNALKYSPNSPQVEIVLRTEAENVMLRVTDKGTGIPPSELPKIFDRFYRVRQGNVHDVKGYGLGLSYVKEMVERHGGKVSVESTPGEGSTFTVKFPGRANG